MKLRAISKRHFFEVELIRHSTAVIQIFKAAFKNIPRDWVSALKRSCEFLTVEVATVTFGALTSSVLIRAA